MTRLKENEKLKWRVTLLITLLNHSIFYHIRVLDVFIVYVDDIVLTDTDRHDIS